METAEALRETSDALLRDLDVLVALEEDKRSLQPGDPRLVELAEQIDQIAERVLGSAGRQRELTKLVNAQVDAGSPHAPEDSIAETVRPIAAILEEWRAAERRALAAEPGSAESDEATALVKLLRAEYRAAQDAARERR
jgi:DNA-binding HxlR family transcriptional regulator